MAPTDPKPAHPQGCTNIKLRQLMRRVAQHYDDEVGKTGLRGTQYALLSYVVKLGPIRAVDLAVHMKLNTSTLSRNLQPLVQAGWLVVRPGNDARSRLIEATDAGKEKRREAQLRWRVAQNGINRMLGDATVVALHALLDEAMERLGPATAGDQE